MIYFITAAIAVVEKTRKRNNSTVSISFANKSFTIINPNCKNIEYSDCDYQELEKTYGCCSLVVRIEACGALDPSSNLGSSTAFFFENSAKPKTTIFRTQLEGNCMKNVTIRRRECHCSQAGSAGNN